ncbi:hypothetical protein DIPPA_03837 [Diplonema papillatum]|nr:hypothetical protein DIPPA_03837 [Diplonema papillatum]
MASMRARDAAEVVDAAAGAAVLVDIFSGAASGERAVRLVLLTSGCFTGSVGDVPVPFSLDPLGLGFEHDNPVAALLGDCIIMAVACTVSFVALKAFRRCSQGSSFDLQGALRLPSVLFLVGRFLYASSMLAACRLLFDSRYFPFVIILLLGAAAPVLLFRKLRQCVPKFARYVADRRELSLVQRVLIGPGEWVNVERGPRWVDCYGGVVKSHTEAAVWWTCVELCTGLALACTSAMQTATFVECGHVKLTCAILCLLRLLCSLFVQPMVRLGSFAADVALSLLEMGATFLLAIGMYLKDDAAGGENWAEIAAAAIIPPATAVWAAGMLLDLCGAVFVVVTGRRGRVQDAYWRTLDRRKEVKPPAVEDSWDPVSVSDVASVVSSDFTHLYRDSAAGMPPAPGNLPSPFTPVFSTGSQYLEPGSHPLQRSGGSSFNNSSVTSAPLSLRGTINPHGGLRRVGHGSSPVLLPRQRSSDLNRARASSQRAGRYTPLDSHGNLSLLPHSSHAGGDAPRQAPLLHTEFDHAHATFSSGLRRVFLPMASITAAASLFRLRVVAQTGADAVYAFVTDKDGDVNVTIVPFAPVAGTTYYRGKPPAGYGALLWNHAPSEGWVGTGRMPFLLIASIAAAASPFRFRVVAQTGADAVYAFVTDKDGDVNATAAPFAPVAGTASIFSVDIPYQADDVRSVSFNSSSAWTILSLEVEGSAGFVQWHAIFEDDVVSSAIVSGPGLPLFFNPARPPVILVAKTADSPNSDTDCPTAVTLTDVYGESCGYILNAERRWKHAYDELIGYTWCPGWLGGADQVEKVHFEIQRQANGSADFWHVAHLRLYHVRAATWSYVYRDGSLRNFGAILQAGETGAGGRWPIAQWAAYYTLQVTVGPDVGDATTNWLGVYNRFPTEVYKSPAIQPVTPGATYETPMKGAGFMEAGLELQGASDALVVTSVLYAASQLDYFEGRMSRLYTFDVMNRTKPPFPELAGTVLDPDQLTGHYVAPFRPAAAAFEVALQFEISAETFAEAVGTSFCLTAVFDDLSTAQLGTLFSPSEKGETRTPNWIASDTAAAHVVASHGSPSYSVTPDTATANLVASYNSTFHASPSHGIAPDASTTHLVASYIVASHGSPSYSATPDTATANLVAGYNIACNVSPSYSVTPDTATANLVASYNSTFHASPSHGIAPDASTTHLVASYIVASHGSPSYSVTPDTATANLVAGYNIACNVSPSYSVTPDTVTAHPVSFNISPCYSITPNPVTTNLVAGYNIACNVSPSYSVTPDTATAHLVPPDIVSFNISPCYNVTPNPATTNLAARYNVASNVSSSYSTTPYTTTHNIAFNISPSYSITPAHIVPPDNISFISTPSYSISPNTATIYLVATYNIAVNISPSHLVPPDIVSFDTSPCYSITPNTATTNLAARYNVASNVSPSYSSTPYTTTHNIAFNISPSYCIPPNTATTNATAFNFSPSYIIATA